MNDPKPMTVLWADAQRSMLEAAEWNASLPAYQPRPVPTATPRPNPRPARETRSNGQ